tara:strand:+ start:1420 stop:1674 length:255 start_codon:yes stop_codon:yes gene_type:complete
MIHVDPEALDKLTKMMDESGMNVMDKVTLLFACAGCIIEIEASDALEMEEWAEIAYATMYRARQVRQLLDGNPEALVDAAVGDA